MARVDFKPDLADIREILHSGPVQEELTAIAKGFAEAANNMARSHGNYRSWQVVPPYDHGMVQGHFTSIGTVHTVSAQGRRDEAAHHTLESLNH